MFETNTSILNELLTVTTNDLLLHLPKVAIPKKLKRSATVNGIRTFTKVSSNQHNAPQDMATDNLAAGVHTSTTPSILLAKDLYAEKLRSMNLERQLSSSRVALRRSQQNERDLKLSAVRKRSQHSKSVWKILDQASKQTLRNPPLALANSVPNLLNTRDPISLLRRAKPILSTNTNDEANEEDLLLLPKYVPQQNHTKRTGSTFKKNKRTKAAAASSRRRRRMFEESNELNETEALLQTNVILQSPSSMKLRQQQKMNNSRGPKTKSKAIWETHDAPRIPEPLPTYVEELISERPIEIEINGEGKTTDRHGNRNSNGKDGNVSRRKTTREENTIINQPRETSLGVGDDGPWSKHYPGSKTKTLLELPGYVPKIKDSKPLQLMSSFLSTIGELQTIQEPPGKKEDMDDEYSGDDREEIDSSTMMLSNDEYNNNGNNNNGNSHNNDTDSNTTINSISNTKKKRRKRRKRYRTPLLQDPYEQFAIELKEAGRKRRRLLQEMLGSLEYEINRLEEKEKKTIQKMQMKIKNQNSTYTLMNDHVLDVVPLTAIHLTRKHLQQIMIHWRLGDSLNINNCLNRLCHRVPAYQSKPLIDGRSLLSAMRIMVGSTNATSAKDIYQLKKIIKKEIPYMQRGDAPLLPGSKLDQRKEYVLPKHTLPNAFKRSKTRWDNDSFDATSMFIVPISDRPN